MRFPDTHRTTLMVYTRNYNHNIDIKSTQVAGAFKSIAKFSLGLGISTVALLGVAIAVAITNESNREKEALSRMRPLDLNTAILDYKRNPVRYDEKWGGEYVSFSGRISGIRSSEFNFNPVQTTRQSSTTVKCDFDYSEKSKVAGLDSGDYVSVLGKLSLRENGSGIFEAHLRNCTIKSSSSSSSGSARQIQQSYNSAPAIKVSSASNYANTCWFQMASGTMAGARCKISTRINANGHNVIDLVEPNGLKRSIVLWSNGDAEVFLRGNRYTGIHSVSNNRISVTVGKGTFQFSSI